jgi:hypothetical protein
VALLLTATIAYLRVTSAAAAASQVSVYFLRGEQLASVQRPG